MAKKLLKAIFKIIKNDNFFAILLFNFIKYLIKNIIFKIFNYIFKYFLKKCY